MNIAIIPARGGSRRIPRKNVRPFAGKPMIAWPISAAIGSGLFDRVIVSTDDPEIAEVAANYGADVPFIRPPELSGDHTGTIPVIRHAIDWLAGQGCLPGAICCIYATAAMIEANDLRRAYDELTDMDADFCFTACEYAAPVHRAFTRSTKGGVEMLFPEHFASRSQDLPNILHDAGQFYWGRPAAWKSNDVLFGEHSVAFEIPRWRVQDIDTPDDWQRAEALFAALGRAVR